MKFSCLLAVAVVVSMMGCGGSGDPQVTAEATEPVREVVVALDGVESPETVGLVMAERDDCFLEEGLEARTLSPVTLDRSIGAVADGTDEFGIAHEPDVLMAAARGAPIVVIASVVSEPTDAMIWLKKAKIRDIADLRGKTIAIPGVSFQKGFLRSYLARGGVALDEVKIIRVMDDLVPALVSGRADAAFGGSWNIEGVDLRSRGLEPVVTRVARFLELPAYDELVVITRRDQLRNPELLRAFLSSLDCGTEAAISDPGDIEDAIQLAVEWNHGPSDRATRAALAATLPLLSRDGRANPDEALALAEWMQREGIIQRVPAVSSLFTDDYLP
ncbi:MAG TPA: ABC transporter substrate-binding protein [Solirubrobacterales bacterium]